MEQRQSVVRQVAFYVTSIALVVSAVRVARTLFESLSPTTRGSRWNGRGAPGLDEASGDQLDGALSASEGEAIVSDIHAISGKGILVTAVVGAAIGAGVALLCAPQSGRASREWLARRTRGLKDRVGVAFDPSPDVIPDGVIPSEPLRRAR